MTAQIINFPTKNPDLTAKQKPRPAVVIPDEGKVVMAIHRQIRKILKQHGFEITKERYNESHKIITDEILYQLNGERK